MIQYNNCVLYRDMLTEENDEILIYFPMMIQSDGTVRSGESAGNEEWDKFRLLSKIDQDILTDDQLYLKMEELQKKFGLSNTSTGYMSFFVRQIFFKELAIEECEAKVRNMLIKTNGGDPNQAKNIVLFIQKEILTIQPKPQEEDNISDSAPKKITESMPLLQALSKYENLGNQLITQERIKIKSQPEPVRPSLLYWIKYYRDELGVGHHSSIDRGNFLFRSQNGAKLSAEERDHVSLILRSIEENMPLTIDTEHQEVLFPAFHPSAPVVPSLQAVSLDPVYEKRDFSMKSTGVSPSAQHNPTFPSYIQEDDDTQRESIKNKEGTESISGTVSFSARHILPAEREVLEKTQKNDDSSLQTPFFAPKKEEIETPPTKIAVPNTMPQGSTNPFIIRPSNRNV